MLDVEFVFAVQACPREVPNTERKECIAWTYALSKRSLSNNSQALGFNMSYFARKARIGNNVEDAPGIFIAIKKSAKNVD
ncbi:hypothetical protein [Ktedonobacter racemifer]|nr:hypothetical protein [Ktedonobacter racemifer]